MRPKLRGHHLICLNFFKGEGYSEEFIRNIYSVLENREIEVVEGADDICVKCPYLEGGKCSSDQYSDEFIRHQDREALKLLGIQTGMVVELVSITEILPHVMEKWRSLFCGECSYRKVCFG